MLRLSRLIFALPVVLTSCASGFQGVRPLTYATPGEAYVYATGEKCVHESAGKEFGGLIAATLTGVASQLLKNFGAALTEGAKGGALPSSTSTVNLQLDPGKVPKCIVIIRGAFQPTKEGESTIDMEKYLGIPDKEAELKKRLEELHLPAIYRIDHYIELRIGASNNSKALTFAPLFVRIKKSIDGAEKGERDLSVAVKFNRAGADPVGSAIIVANRKVDDTASKWEPLKNGRYAIEAPWFGTFHAPPALAGTSAAVGDAGVGAGGSAIASAPAGPPGSTVPAMQSDREDAVPVTVTATVVETRPTNEGLAFVASIFNGIEPKLEEAIKPILDSDARKAADAAEATATLGAQADYASAEGTAFASLITYCSTASTQTTAAGKQDRLNKSKDARNAQLKANVAAINAEVKQPFAKPKLVTISAELPSTINSEPCSGI